MFCVLCRRLFWRDRNPQGGCQAEASTRSPQGGGPGPKQCPGERRAMDIEINSGKRFIEAENTLHKLGAQDSRVWLQSNRVWCWIIALDGIMRRKK
jgi:hypothetical protein